MKHCGTQPIRTERLTLRRYAVDDSEEMFRWGSDDQVTHFLPWPTYTSVDGVRAVLTEWEAQYNSDTFYEWAIIPDEENAVMGGIGVVRFDEGANTMEVGYVLSRECWGKGYAAEALKAVLNYLFTNVGPDRITAKHDTENVNSGRVMQKAGMRYLKTCEKYAETNLGLRDMTIYEITRTNAE